ncbi:hypothetical protein ACRQHG_08695 [Actinotignum sp. GS-2025a]
MRDRAAPVTRSRPAASPREGTVSTEQFWLNLQSHYEQALPE